MICFRCNKPIVQTSPFLPGYARDSRHNVLCYACCGDLDRKQLESEDRAVLYLTGSHTAWAVGNWPGTLKIQAAVKQSTGSVGGRIFNRRDVWFIGPDGDHWYGRNQGYNDLVYCRRLTHKQPWIDRALGE